MYFIAEQRWKISDLEMGIRLQSGTGGRGGRGEERHGEKTHLDMHNKTCDRVCLTQNIQFFLPHKKQTAENLRKIF